MSEQRSSIIQQLGWMASVYIVSVVAMIAFSYAGRWLVKCVLKTIQAIS